MAKFKAKVSARFHRKKTKKHWFLSQKTCRFCNNKDQEDTIDYKNADMLNGFLTERGKILPSRISGNCFFHQRRMSNAVKVARSMALLPYCSVLPS
jgi:small subunit ribosomal protein S18